MALHLPSISELRNTQAELQRFRQRVTTMQAVMVVCFLLLLSRLIYLQVLEHEDLLEQAENNRTAVLPTVPPRGAILDRNGVVLASNYSAYTLEITPSRVADLEATIQALSEIVGFDPLELELLGLAAVRQFVNAAANDLLHFFDRCGGINN